MKDKKTGGTSIKLPKIARKKERQNLFSFQLNEQRLKQQEWLQQGHQLKQIKSVQVLIKQRSKDYKSRTNIYCNDNNAINSFEYSRNNNSLRV